MRRPALRLDHDAELDSSDPHRRETSRFKPPPALLQLARASDADRLGWFTLTGETLDPENDTRPTQPSTFWVEHIDLRSEIRRISPEQLADVVEHVVEVSEADLVVAEERAYQPVIAPPFQPPPSSTTPLRATSPSILRAAARMRGPGFRRVVAIASAIAILAGGAALAHAMSSPNTAAAP